MHTYSCATDTSVEIWGQLIVSSPFALWVWKVELRLSDLGTSSLSHSPGSLAPELVTPAFRLCLPTSPPR